MSRLFVWVDEKVDIETWRAPIRVFNGYVRKYEYGVAGMCV